MESPCVCEGFPEAVLHKEADSQSFGRMNHIKGGMSSTPVVTVVTPLTPLRSGSRCVSVCFTGGRRAGGVSQAAVVFFYSR